MDLTSIRQNLTELKTVCLDHLDSKYLDQDALNECFATQWLPLSLKWNAQGLGTYADADAPELGRNTLNKAELSDPSIVHFTGPLHPTLAEVINPHVRPYTSKPWGYAGAPGNPYTPEWCKCLELTPYWKHHSFEEHKKNSRELRNKRISEGLALFESEVAKAWL